MVNLIIVLVLLCIVSGIIWYLVIAKKRGVKCVGCPYAKQCKNKCNSTCNKQNNNSISKK